MSSNLAPPTTPVVAEETADMAPEPDGPQVATETPDMATEPDGPQVATETPDMAPNPDGSDYQDENGQIDITEWIVSNCTFFFTGHEETIKSFGENPEAWCGTYLPPDCGPQDISRCMPEILERCGQSGGDSESSSHLARYCGTFSHNSSSTYTESSSGGGYSHTNYSSGTHCACDTVVNEICYTVNVYHQTNIYVHVEGGTTTTGCFGDRTPCTTTEIDDDFGCEYPEEIPVWDSEAPNDGWFDPIETMPTTPEGGETPGMTPPPTASTTTTQETRPAAEAAAGTIDPTPMPTTMMPGRADPAAEDSSTPPAESVEPPAPAFGQGDVPDPSAVTDPAAPTDAPAVITDPPEGGGFGEGAASEPVVDPVAPVEAPANDLDVPEIVPPMDEAAPDPVASPEPAYEAPAETFVAEAVPEPADDPADPV